MQTNSNLVRRTFAIPAMLMVASLLASCSDPQPVDPATLVARAEALQPADARIADLYQHACRACHVIPTSSAPLTGDRDAWRQRMKKGLPKLVDNAIAGLNGMPAGGQCVRCTAADYDALIRFMAGEAR